MLTGVMNCAYNQILHGLRTSASPAAHVTTYHEYERFEPQFIILVSVIFFALNSIDVVLHSVAPSRPLINKFVACVTSQNWERRKWECQTTTSRDKVVLPLPIMSCLRYNEKLTLCA